jgi:uncharacterized membrane protein YbhN (UPF0104 family)
MDNIIGAKTMKKILKYIEIILTLALLIFIAIKAQDFLKSVDWSRIPDIWFSIFISSVLFTIGYSMLAQHWLLVAREIVPKITSSQRLAFFASQPYKYLPTSLFTLSFRAKYSKKLGMGLKDSSKAQIIENINMVGTALMLAGVLLLFFWNSFLGVIAIASLGFFAAILWKNHHITIHIFKTGIKFHMRCWLKAVGWCLMAWSVVGCGFYVLAASLEPNVNIFKSIAASSLAIGSGMLVIIAPGGIGVREAVFASFGFIASTIIIWRCITFIVDIIIGFLSIYAIERRR